MTKKIILTEEQVQRKLERIAFEIYENHIEEKELIIAGIKGQGFVLAGLLEEKINHISPVKTRLIKLDIDKHAPFKDEGILDTDVQGFKGKNVLIVDDVLNTGRTVTHAIRPFLFVELKKLEVAVLVNRSHSAFPVMATYSGYDLATTINEHVEVDLGKKKAVYLY